MDKDSAAYCNSVVFLPLVDAPVYFGYVGYHQFYFGVFGLYVVAFGLVWFGFLLVAALDGLAGAGALCVLAGPSQSNKGIQRRSSERRCTKTVEMLQSQMYTVQQDAEM